MVKRLILDQNENMYRILCCFKNFIQYKYLIIWFIFLFFFQAPHLVCAQSTKNLRFGFYNLENFFDTEVDSTLDYNAFTPDGEQRWTLSRYLTKRNNVFKTIVSMGHVTPPTLIGFCEVENESVLFDLITRTPLKALDYRIVHFESPDRRGIDVGLIYRKTMLTLLVARPIPVKDTNDVSFLTRDILFASFLHNDSDTVYVYVNHWPSRYGGQLESVKKRLLAATTLRQHVDSVLNAHPLARIVIMGDFNDTPNDESIIYGLKAFSPESINSTDQLVHLFTSSDELGYEGTLKHQHSWQIFDQIMISQHLYNANEGLRFRRGGARIFAPSFLLMDDERHLGKKLYRTYTGPTYIGGFSDHLPVFIDLEWTP